MNLLYAGKYKKRFGPITSFIGTLPPRALVLEVCFGDIFIAEYCRKHGYRWRGIDINPKFVKAASSRGFAAETADLAKENRLPEADLCVMAGSLYHFHNRAHSLLASMLQAAPEVIISEPVINLSMRRGLIGRLARKSADAGNGQQTFRYDRESLLSLLKEERSKLGFHITDVRDHGRDLVIQLTRHEKH